MTMTDSAPSSMRTVIQVLGVLLIVQAVVRLGLAGWNFSQASEIILRSPEVLTFAFVVPAILGIATLVAGIMMTQLLPAARAFGIAICAVCLAQSAFGFATTLYRIMTISSLRLPWQFWVLTPTFFALFLVSLICLILWRPRGAPAA